MSARLPGEAVAQALHHALSSGTDHYDDIAFRYFEACRTNEIIGFETLTSNARAERRNTNLRLPAEVQRLLDQGVDLVHRPIELPSGEFDFIVRDGLVQARAMERQLDPRFSRPSTG